MSGNVLIIISFLFFMFIFAGVGLASIRVKKDTTDDYLVAGRGMHPALAALSAVSTWNSGYMFIGAIGFTYMMGYNIIWMAIMSMMGQILAWAWLYKFIQKEGRDRGVRSLSSLVAEKAGAPEAKLAAVLSVLFLSIYAAAQLTSGGKALLVMMGWPELVGILIGFVLVVAYCYAGGIRASIWTDAVQSCVMIVGSLILCWIALGDVGGFSGLNAGLESQDPALTNIMPPNLIFGLSLWAFAFFLGGLAVAGQPQVVSRVMTLGSDKDRKEAMLWFFVWQTPFLILMTFIGLASRVIFSENDFDPELGLPMLAMDTMPAIGVGMILASIFAATMSTADSQVLACTAAITDDIKPEWRDDHKTTKKVTLFVAAFATAISVAGLYVPGGDSVFALVVLAVYGLGGVFVPLLIIRWAGYKPDTTHSISMMVAAFAGVIGWTIILPIMGISWSGADGIFPSVPGMGAAFATHFWLCWKREESVDNPFGRYSIPTKKFTTIGAVILLAFVGGMEGSYQVFAPDSTSSVDEIGSYEITGEITYHEITSGSEYILDGEDTMLEMEISGPEDDGEFSMLNIVGVRATLTYTDDEQSPAGCGSAEDSVSGHLMYSDLHATEEVNSGAAVEILWYNSSIIGTTVSDMSKTDIIGMLENEDYLGFGDHFLQISVDVNKGDCIDPFRETSDDGEDVSYLWELMTLDYSITMV
ncbi:MAG: sodium/proline symporter [Candidatus Poseidoniaceae archaeon]|jgi:sodium/proline symporter|nr:sodium/proline symporter [Candidatus Poseidoniaceae archaeon]